MIKFFRMILGLVLLPMCWSVILVLRDVLVSGESLLGVKTYSLLSGAICFLILLFFVPKLRKTYVFGHEMTHALWGIFFGAWPSNLRVNDSGGGSVTLTKTNMFILLAPYFFPFYTFIVGLCAFLVWLFIRQIPCLPIWLFLIGFTWVFHLAYTIDSLRVKQSDITPYGRIFSWTFIFLINISIIIICIVSSTSFTFKSLVEVTLKHICEVYVSSYLFCIGFVRLLISKFS